MTARRTITIADYDERWPARFEAERARIAAACAPDAFVAIEHIGSTSVPGLGAKPVIDIMPGLRSLEDAPPIVEALVAAGYQYVPEFEDEMPYRRYFRRDEARERAIHIHMVEVGSDFWRKQLLFRDWLRTHPEDAAAYERLKRDLAANYNARPEDNLSVDDGYTDFKTDFVLDVLERATAAAA